MPKGNSGFPFSGRDDMPLKYPKQLRYAEINASPHVIQVAFEEVHQIDFPLKGTWAREFFRNENPVVLEIGCGRGEYTLALAQRSPDKNFLGLDMKGARIWRGCRNIDALGLKNAGFVRSRGEFLLSLFAPGELSEIWITFPDPHFKKPRRRLIAPMYLGWYHQLLPPNGLLHLKTDSSVLHDVLIEDAENGGFRIESHTLDIQGDLASGSPRISPVVAGDLQIKTTYEERWVREGKRIKYVRLRRQGEGPESG
jgi:tRNA (guanine-N7-)-methyltransferase